MSIKRSPCPLNSNEDKQENGKIDIENQIDFIFSHFEEPLFPRKMMTFVSNGQFTVTSKEDVIQRCKESNFVDCCINAYPEYIQYKGIIRQSPNFIFIDLDLSNFIKYKNPRKMLDRVLGNTLKNISECGQERSQRSQRSCVDQHHNVVKPIQPSVLWTGNGYHIYLPIQSVVLDEYEPFSKDRFQYLFSSFGKYGGCSVSEVFLKYAEGYFTNGKADPQHRPKFKSCLIRFPDTFNSKCLSNGLSYEESKVKTIQKWNGYRLPIQLLAKEFRRWLVQEEINHKSLMKRHRNSQGRQLKESGDFQVNWIERLLKTGISDGRKESLRLILGPYLIKRKNYEESVILLQEWLEKCNTVKPLDRNFNPQQRIKSSLKNTKGFLILESLKMKYPWLYSVINSCNAN